MRTRCKQNLLSQWQPREWFSKIVNQYRVYKLVGKHHNHKTLERKSEKMNRKLLSLYLDGLPGCQGHLTVMFLLWTTLWSPIARSHLATRKLCSEKISSSGRRQCNQRWTRCIRTPHGSWLDCHLGREFFHVSGSTS